MKLRRLMFLDKMALKVEYGNLTKSLRDMDEFLEGYIGESKTSVFFRSRLFGLPLTKVLVTKTSHAKGELIITLKMVDVVPLIYGLSILLVWRDFIVDVSGRGPQDGLFTAILVTFFFYGFLQYRYYAELLNFRVALKRIEVHWRNSNAREQKL
jgi:hypothetical protein